MQKDVLYGLRQGNQVLKAIHREMSLESVEKLMEETADGLAYQREISAMLAGRMSNEEEDEAEDELAQMEREERLKSAPDPVPAMPSVPGVEPLVRPKETGEQTEEQRKAQKAKERAKARRAELARESEREREEPMLAS